MPTAAPTSGTRFTRASDRTPLKFLRTLRGEGRLLTEAGESPVGYQLDLYESRVGRTGSGTLEGALTDAMEGDARLRLDDGAELGISVFDADADGAAFEARAGLAAID